MVKKTNIFFEKKIHFNYINWGDHDLIILDKTF